MPAARVQGCRHSRRHHRRRAARAAPARRDARDTTGSPSGRDRGGRRWPALFPSMGQWPPAQPTCGPGTAMRAADACVCMHHACIGVQPHLGAGAAPRAAALCGRSSPARRQRLGCRMKPAAAGSRPLQGCPHCGSQTWQRWQSCCQRLAARLRHSTAAWWCVAATNTPVRAACCACCRPPCTRARVRSVAGQRGQTWRSLRSGTCAPAASTTRSNTAKSTRLPLLGRPSALAASGRASRSPGRPQSSPEWAYADPGAFWRLPKHPRRAFIARAGGACRQLRRNWRRGSLGACGSAWTASNAGLRTGTRNGG